MAITVLGVLAGCARNESPQAQADDEDAVATAVQRAPAAPPPPKIVDRTKGAAEMVALLDPGPQCQQYRDELQAKGSTPGVMDELNEILVRAYQAGCGKKKGQ